jgi:hypothetical protein
VVSWRNLAIGLISSRMVLRSVGEAQILINIQKINLFALTLRKNEKLVFLFSDPLRSDSLRVEKKQKRVKMDVKGTHESEGIWRYCQS